MHDDILLSAFITSRNLQPLFYKAFRHRLKKSPTCFKKHLTNHSKFAAKPIHYTLFQSTGGDFSVVPLLERASRQTRSTKMWYCRLYGIMMLQHLDAWEILTNFFFCTIFSCQFSAGISFIEISRSYISAGIQDLR